MKQVKMDIEEIWDVDEEGGLIKIGLKSVLPPRTKQREQKGTVKRKYKLKYKRKTTAEKTRDAIKAKRRYKRNPRRHIRYQERRRKSPSLFKRMPAGGISSQRQKQERDKKTREKNK